jgi:hypothetical protein
MPIFLTPVFGVILGITLCWMGRDELNRYPQMQSAGYFGTRPFQVAAAFSAFILLPVQAYLMVFYGDWSYLYLLPWARVPSAVDLTLVLIAASSPALGFLAVTSWSMRGRFDWVSRVWLGLLVAGSLTGALLWKRLTVSASFTQYKEHFGIIDASGSSLGVALLLAWAAMGIGTFWALRNLRAKPEEN